LRGEAANPKFQNDQIPNKFQTSNTKSQIVFVLATLCVSMFQPTKPGNLFVQFGILSIAF